jgi:hypothetical protein
MQQDAALAGLALEVRILGVNGIGQESGNTLNCTGRTLPWLQDVPAQNVWTSWLPTYRDVVIVDDENHRVTAYNLTAHDLTIQANYDELRALLVSTASTP